MPSLESTLASLSLVDGGDTSVVDIQYDGHDHDATIDQLDDTPSIPVLTPDATTPDTNHHYYYTDEEYVAAADLYAQLRHDAECNKKRTFRSSSSSSRLLFRKADSGFSITDVSTGDPGKAKVIQLAHAAMKCTSCLGGEGRGGVRGGGSMGRLIVMITHSFNTPTREPLISPVSLRCDDAPTTTQLQQQRHPPPLLPPTNNTLLTPHIVTENMDTILEKTHFMAYHASVSSPPLNSLAYSLPDSLTHSLPD